RPLAMRPPKKSLSMRHSRPGSQSSLEVHAAPSGVSLGDEEGGLVTGGGCAPAGVTGPSVRPSEVSPVASAPLSPVPSVFALAGSVALDDSTEPASAERSDGVAVS